MSELHALVEAARAERAAGRAFVSATVMAVRGSAYRHAGARMLAADAGWLAGSISGGCLEREVLTRGFHRTRNGPVLAVYDAAEAGLDEATGSGCQGVIEFLLERCEKPGRCDALSFIERCIAEETRGVIVSVFRSQRDDVPVGARLTLLKGESAVDFEATAPRALLLTAAHAALARGGSTQVSIGRDLDTIEALVEVIEPPPHLFVFGSGHDVTPLLGLAKQLGWSVSIWDAQPRISARERLRAADAYLTGELDAAIARLNRCARPAAVVMGHHLGQDEQVLGALLGSRAHYIGVLGPRRRTEHMLDACAARGVRPSPEARAHLYAPVGLQIGAHTPAEIALAILSEAQAALSGAPAHSLRELPDLHPVRSSGAAA
jgi:xanthine dehydrogenase accessory factor